jgi:hypothetical protein
MKIQQSRQESFKDKTYAALQQIQADQLYRAK